MITIKLNNIYVKTALGVLVCTLKQETIQYSMHLSKEEKAAGKEVVMATGKFYPDQQVTDVFRRMAKRNKNVTFTFRAKFSIDGVKIRMDEPVIKFSPGKRYHHKMPVNTLKRLLTDHIAFAYDLEAAKKSDKHGYLSLFTDVSLRAV